MELQTRNFGLDIVRASAVILVLVNHIINFFVTFAYSTTIGDVSGFLGVEIFFVLSGYLIGQIMFTRIYPATTFAQMKHFYIRRWFRTLPLYYLLLFVFIILGVFYFKNLSFPFLHLVFLQNIVPKSLEFFSVSWSLAIEEWFYLLIPVALLLVSRSKKQIRPVLLVSSFILIMLFIRLVYVSVLHPSFDDIRKHVFLRFDSLLIGVLIAAIKMDTGKIVQKIYAQLLRPTHIIGIMCFLVLCVYSFAFLFRKEIQDMSFFAKVFGLPILSLSFALLLPFFELNFFINNTVGSWGWIRTIIVQVSLWSYSLYLVHLEIFQGVISLWGKKYPSFLLAVPALVMTFVISFLLYRFVEQPFMHMRKKFAQRDE